MKIKSDIITAASGSIGGVTYSHGRGGLERKARLNRSDAQNNLQNQVRARFAKLGIMWSNELSQVNRNSWSNYAAATPLRDRFGGQKLISGHQMFLRCNAPRIQIGLILRKVAPDMPGLAEVSKFTFVVSATTNQIVITYTNTQFWANTAQGAILIQTSRFGSSGRASMLNNFRFLTFKKGSPSSPPTQTLSTLNAFGEQITTALIGRPIGFRVMTTDKDARLGPVIQQTAIVIA